MRILRGLLSLTVGAVAAVVVASPRRDSEPGPSIEGLVEELQTGGMSGRDLAQAAIAAVSGSYEFYSAWHLWESPRRSLRERRGWSHQYNAVLAEVLSQLGFETRLVHAAWTRGTGDPWWHSGHTWVKVKVDGYWFDACASRTDNRLGDLPMTYVSEELPYRTQTRIAMTLFLAPFVVAAVWRHWLTGKLLPSWIYRRRRHRGR